MSDENSSFLREVQQEVRRERLVKLADKYGLVVGVAVGVLILGGLFYYLYVNSVRESAERAGNTFIVAERLLQDDQVEEATKEFQRLVDEGGGAYVPLARLRLAAIALEAGKTDEAKSYFAAVAEDESADETLRSHAALQLVAVDIGQLDWTTAKNRLTEFMDDEDTYRHSARELLALVAYREDKYLDATQILTGLLSDQSAPQGVRQRAQVLMGLITAERQSEAPTDAEDETNKKLPPSEGQSGDASESGQASGTEKATAGGGSGPDDVARSEKPTN